MVDWPDTLAQEILKERCILFLGAGVSASAADDRGDHPPEWAEFLRDASALVKDGGRREAVDRLINENRLLVALQAIKDLSDPAEYNQLLDRNFNNRQYKPSELHKLINELDCRIVITTNFDKIYETYCLSFPGSGHAFKVINYMTPGLADELRSDTRLIIKAHGTIDSIPEMIFTRAQYHKAKQDHSNFYDILKALFLTNTILFIGCSLDDPDILLILEDVRIMGNPTKPHYAIIKKGKSEFLIRDWRATHNIHVLEYEPDHAAVVPALNELVQRVNEKRAASSGIIQPPA